MPTQALRSGRAFDRLINFSDAVVPLRMSMKIKGKNGPRNLIMGAVVMFSWGISDAMIQALAYWQLGIMFQGRAQVHPFVCCCCF